MRTSERVSYRQYQKHILSFLFLYFLQGIPYGLQTRFLPLYFRMHGMPLAAVGLFKLLLVPWVLKIMWAPFVDTYSTKKTWLSGSVIVLAVLCLVAAQFPPENVVGLAVIMLAFNLVSSVQDIALDALVISSLTPAELTAGNMAQVVGYKVGTMFSGGVFAALTGYITWEEIFYTLAGIYFTGVIVSEFHIPNLSPTRNIVTPTRALSMSTQPPGLEDTNSAPHVPSSDAATDTCSYIRVFSVDGTVWTVLFVLIYKAGEQGVVNLYPLFLLDSGVDPSQIGIWTGFTAQSLSIVGSIISAAINVRSLLKPIFLLLAVRAGTIIIIWVAMENWQRHTDISYACSMFSLQLLFLTSGGLTTYVFTLLMAMSKRAPSTCHARHYTVLVTAETLGKLFFSSAIGALTQLIGYNSVFALFSVVSLLVIPLALWAPDSVDLEEDE